MQTSHKEEYTDVYAGFFVRLVAFSLDLIVVGIGSLVVKGMLSLDLLENNLLSNHILFHYSIIDILLYVLKSAYFVVCTYTSGATLGKYIMKIKVIDKNRNTLNMIQVLYRETVGRFLSSFFFIGYIMIIIDKENKALHDRLCDTSVIYSCKVIRQIEIHQSQDSTLPQMVVESVAQEPMEDNTKEA